MHSFFDCLKFSFFNQLLKQYRSKIFQIIFQTFAGWSVKTTIREGGCSRTTPRCVVKTEPGQPTPCQVQEVTTSCKTTCTDLQASSPHGSSPSSSSYCVLGRGIVSQRNFYSTSSSSTSSLMDGNKNARGGKKEDSDFFIF